MTRIFITVLCLGGSLAPALGQLAITEAMSSASQNLGTEALTQMADFWELTNFGTNAIDLTGYTWNDNSGGLEGGDDSPFDRLTIAAGDCILFVQFETNKPITEQEVRDWWGPCLPSSTRIVFYGNNGLNQMNDGIRLWAKGETNNANVVDRVDFGQARRGRTFTYDPQTGIFGPFSVEGIGGACKAATRDDVGSPGTTTGPVPLQILMQPLSLSTCAGVDVTFSVQAGGLPRAKFRWLFNGSVIPGATASSHTVVNPQANNAGQYQVEVSNGFETLLSQVATLTVSSDPVPPSPCAPMTDVLALIGETARFTVPVCAFPPPTFQWQSNGVALPGETNRMLVLPNVQLAMSGTRYCVQVQNPIGSTSVCARLTVTLKPNLTITEVHPDPSMNFAGNADWFELTNCDTNAVNLLGFRWATGNGMAPSLEEPRVVEDSVVLQPGQSAIFVERLTRNQFLQWWGANRVPPGLIVLTYIGEGLDAAGDELYFWSPGATDPTDCVTSICWAGANSGVSKIFQTNCSGFDCLDYDSTIGESGAFRAAKSDDIGSPGWSRCTPWLVSGRPVISGVELTWQAPPGSTNLVQYQPWGATNWVHLCSLTFTQASQRITDTTIFTEPLQNRYYRTYRITCLAYGQMNETAWRPWRFPESPVIIFPSVAYLLGNPCLTLWWTTESNSTCVLQYRTNMASGEWTSLCTNVATSEWMSASETNIRRDTQRFYRVIRQQKQP